MKQGYVILIVIALMFIGIYVFAHYSVYLGRLKRKKVKIEEEHQEELRLEELARKQEARDAKWRKMDERRELMKQDLVRIEEIKQEWVAKGRPLT